MWKGITEPCERKDRITNGGEDEGYQKSCEKWDTKKDMRMIIQKQAKQRIISDVDEGYQDGK